MKARLFRYLPSLNLLFFARSLLGPLTSHRLSCQYFLVIHQYSFKRKTNLNADMHQTESLFCDLQAQDWRIPFFKSASNLRLSSCLLLLCWNFIQISTMNSHKVPLLVCVKYCYLSKSPNPQMHHCGSSPLWTCSRRLASFIGKTLEELLLFFR